MADRCCMCLSGERRRAAVSARHLQHMLLISLDLKVVTWLCWECEARLSRLSAFRLQVEEAQRVLLKLPKGNVRHSVRSLSTLSCHHKSTFDACFVEQNETSKEESLSAVHEIYDTKIKLEKANNECEPDIQGTADSNDEIKINALKNHSHIGNKLSLTSNLAPAEQISAQPQHHLLHLVGVSDAFDLSAGVTKEEMNPEPWGVMQEVDSPPLGNEECEMPQQGAALSPVKHEIDIEEHDPVEHPRALLASRNDKESATTSQLTPMVGASTIKQEELMSTTRLFSPTVLLSDCAAELQQSGRYCQECRVQFSSRSSLADHSSSAHVQSGAKTGPKIVARHIRTINYRDSLLMPKEKSHKCDQCEYTCTERRKLIKHLMKHTGAKPIKCDQCEYTCTERSKLKRHLMKHTGEKPFKCDQCEYRCITRCNLNRHLKTHTGEKPYKCDECKYRFTQMVTLKQHIRTHRGEKTLKCDLCDYKCCTRSYLNNHLKTHSKEKRYKCAQCDYKSKYLSIFKYHLRTHTGGKPFECDLCEFTSVYRNNLIIHLRKHTGEKQFQCDQCKYRCCRKSALQKHIRTHEN